MYYLSCIGGEGGLKDIQYRTQKSIHNETVCYTVTLKKILLLSVHSRVSGVPTLTPCDNYSPSSFFSIFRLM